MMLNDEDVRELWLVEFDSRIFKRAPGQPMGVIDVADQEVKIGVHVWATSGEEACEIVKTMVERPGPEQVPWLGLVGLQRLGLIESKIINQPVRLPALQPAPAPTPAPTSH
jgi:hypothetical protein